MNHSIWTVLYWDSGTRNREAWKPNITELNGESCQSKVVVETEIEKEALAGYDCWDLNKITCPIRFFVIKEDDEKYPTVIEADVGVGEVYVRKAYRDKLMNMEELKAP